MDPTAFSMLILGIGQILTVLMTLFTAISTWLARHKFSGLAADMKELTLNTNSIKDALVAATDKAAGLEGEKRGAATELARQTKEGLER